MTNQNNCTLPAVPFGSAKISRLIIGGNPFKGNSHCDSELDQAMRDYYTSEQIVQTLQNAEKAGLTAMQMRGDQQIIDIVEKYRQAGGTMQWICQTASEWPDVSENIRVTAGHNPLGIYHHGTNTDQPPFTPSAPVQRRLQGPPAKSKFLAVSPPAKSKFLAVKEVNFGNW